jgi:hypothetical protein
MTSLMNRFNKTQHEVAEKLSKIPIVHLYGKLGALPWENSFNEYSRDYSPIVYPHHLRRSSKDLKIIYDRFDENNPEFKKAKMLMSAARRIYFLGFGYHNDNLERLKIKTFASSAIQPTTSMLNTIPPRVIEGTSFKLSLETIEKIPKVYKIKLPNSEWDINEFIEQRIRLDK